MASRYISTSFWDDAWVESLEPTQRYLYLYLLTNPLTNIAGVYKITKRRMQFDTGLETKEIEEALKNFADNKKAYFDGEEWIILPNWPKHQSPDTRVKIRAGINKVLEELPDEIWELIHIVGYDYPHLDEVDRKKPDIDKTGYHTDTISIPYPYEPNYIDLDLDIDIDLDKDKTLCPAQQDGTHEDSLQEESVSREYKDSRKEESTPPYKAIIDYLNQTCGKSYRHSSKANQRLIRARWSEGYRLDDFKKVIDTKLLDSTRKWKDGTLVFDPMYLRPETLFGKKFEGYLNQPQDKTVNYDDLFKT